MGEVVFIFDGDCGFCRKWAGWLQQRIDTAVLFVPFQAVEDLAEFGLTIEDVRAASYLNDHGRSYCGGRAFAKALRRGRGMWKLVGLALDTPGVRAVTDKAYRAIARNRHWLPAPRYDISR
jgi:predicted DCC family thiol-disulfide oxidoreductase YuxK